MTRLIGWKEGREGGGGGQDVKKMSEGEEKKARKTRTNLHDPASINIFHRATGLRYGFPPLSSLARNLEHLHTVSSHQLSRYKPMKHLNWFVSSCWVTRRYIESLLATRLFHQTIDHSVINGARRPRLDTKFQVSYKPSFRLLRNSSNATKMGTEATKDEKKA